MSDCCEARPIKLGKANFTVAVCGNPNAGKTTLFNALTGLSQKVANYPGVTVEKVVGTYTYRDSVFQVLDIPGAYSLAAYSPDEAIAAAALLGYGTGEPRPDAAIVVVDATNIERGLYLVSQVLELEIPVVVALNMYDIAQRRGIRIDHHELSRSLGVPVLPIVAQRGEGVASLKAELMTVVTQSPPVGVIALPDTISTAMAEVETIANSNGHPPISRGMAFRLLFDDQGYLQDRIDRDGNRVLSNRLTELRGQIHTSLGSGAETRMRTTWAGTLADRTTERPTDQDASFTSKIDRFVLHRFIGPVIMLVLMVAVFQAIFSWAQPVMELVDTGFTALAASIGGAMPPGALNSLVTDGIIGGVGAVLMFLPQILILFFFIGVLEDSGYMPRAAFLVDRIFKGCGLSGRSFIPLLSSFACAVPGIMATRTIDNRRQRFLTIMVAPLMTCSARLPIYAVFIAAFVPAVSLGIFNLQGLTLAALYALGIVTAVLIATLLKRSVLRGPTASFVMELPSYKVPKWSNVFLQMYHRGRAFVVRAGTVILALTVVIWGLSYYPRSEQSAAALQSRLDSAPTEAARTQLTRDYEAEQLQNSYLGRAGRLLEPVSMYLGWDWKITVAAVAAFPAREVVISTLGTLYNLGAEGADDDTPLIDKLRDAKWDHGPLQGQPVFTVPVAASIMVFFALCCQCMATLATIRRETNSWRWPIFVFSYMTALALAGSLLVYQAGVALGLGGLG